MPILAVGNNKYSATYPHRITAGFSLIELLAVTAIISLLLLLIPPLLPNVADSTRSKSIARELANSLRVARTYAITEHKEIVLLLDVKQQYYILHGRKKHLDIPEETTLELLTANSEVISPQQGQIRFFPDGSSTGGKITLQSPVMKLLIDVHWLTGRVRIHP